MKVNGKESGNLATLRENGSCQNSCGSSSITCFVICLTCHAPHQLCSNVLELILELYCLCHRHSILCDLWSSVRLINHNIPSLLKKKG